MLFGFGAGSAVSAVSAVSALVCGEMAGESSSSGLQRIHFSASIAQVRPTKSGLDDPRGHDLSAKTLLWFQDSMFLGFLSLIHPKRVPSPRKVGPHANGTGDAPPLI